MLGYYDRSVLVIRTGNPVHAVFAGLRRFLTGPDSVSE